jgi:hypothetical protein
MQPNEPLNPNTQPVVQPAPNMFQSSVPAQAMQPVQITPVSTAALAPIPKSGGIGSHIVEIILGLLLAGALGFGIWAFMGRMDYKSNSDKKSAVAVEKANAAQKIKLDAEYVEKDKLPYDTYSGPGAAGSIKMQYPKTWSAFINEQASSSNPIVGYFHPGFVPDTNGQATAFALRLEVVSTQYSEVLRQYESYVKSGTIAMAPYSFPGVPSVLGAKLSGNIVSGSDKVVGTIVLMPLRDKTIKVWTESNSAFLPDFEAAVLANFTFVP